MHAIELYRLQPFVSTSFYWTGWRGAWGAGLQIVGYHFKLFPDRCSLFPGTVFLAVLTISEKTDKLKSPIDGTYVLSYNE